MDWDAYLDAASAAADLPVAPEHRPGALRFLVLAAEMAAALEAVPLDESDLSLAPVFRLPDPAPDSAPDPEETR